MVLDEKTAQKLLVKEKELQLLLEKLPRLMELAKLRERELESE